MKRFTDINREVAAKSDFSFLLGWTGVIALMILGDIIDIRDRGLFTWWGLVYILSGVGIYLIGQKLAVRMRLREFSRTYATGYGDGASDVLKSLDQWNGRP